MTSHNDGHRPQILLCEHISQVGIDMLNEHVDVDIRYNLSPDELKQTIPNYNGIIVRSETQLDADTLNHALKLKIIGNIGSALDNIDVAAAQEKEILIVNSPGLNTLAVAEHTLGLMLALARRVPSAVSSLMEGRWEKQQFLGTSLSGKTLGIIGFGRIGREVAHRAQAFNMKILINQKTETPESLLDHVESVDLDDLLAQSDFVTLHVPLRDETRNLLSQEKLGLMKPSAYLINTARGALVDEGALLNKLNAGTIAGAALDVFHNEPAPNSALVQHERVIATPHIAASTTDAQDASAITIAEEIIEFFQEVDVESILPLRVVQLDKVVPHEYIDQKRVDRLKARLNEDARLSNPPIVMETTDGRYMVLDGATRTAAMKQLGFPHAVVQVSSPEAGLGLATWFHLVENISINDFFNLVNGLSDTNLEAINEEDAAEKMFQFGGLCTIHLVDGRVFLVHAKPGINRMDALNQLTAAYIQASHTERTLEHNVITLKTTHPNFTALVKYPEYTVEQVMQFSLLNGRYFPAGITRFLIPGRILRINADISILKSDQSLREKNRWLHKVLMEKQQKGGIRYYGEPVYLLDE
ncbi:MAG: NAD(P)-dependent oxidoreductase [Chloroflexota bacterium]